MSIDLRVDYTKQDKQRLDQHMIGWTKVHAYICQLATTEESMLELRKMLSIELDERARPQVLTRLKARYNAIRTPLEEKDIFARASLRMVAQAKEQAALSGVKAKARRLIKKNDELQLALDYKDARK